MKKYSSQQYAKALYEVTQDLNGAVLEKTLDAFIERLIRDRRQGLLKRIVVDYVAYARKRDGKEPIHVTTRFGLNTKTKKALQETFGDEILFEESVDPDMLGGVSVRSGDTIYNASIKKQIEVLTSKLIGD